MDNQAFKLEQIQINKIFKEMGDLYHGYAKEKKVSDSMLEILYTLRLEKEPMSQADICDKVFLPRQTINTTIKKLEIEQYIYLRYIESKKKKIIFLTPKGEAFCKQIADDLIEKEIRALHCFTKEEREMFIALYQKYGKNMEKVFKEKKEDIYEGKTI